MGKSSNTGKTSVCIVGGGFAGLNAARQLRSDRFSVTVVDPSRQVEWLPNIHEIISGRKNGKDLFVDRRRLVRRMGHDFQQAQAIHIDDSVVHLADGHILPFDICIVAVGGIAYHADIPGATQYAIGMKSIADCQRINAKLRGAMSDDKTVKVAIVGAGIEGVEALGELLRVHRRRGNLSIVVTDRNRRILPSCAGNLDSRVRKLAQKYNVEFLLGRKVAEMREDALVLEDGRIIHNDLTIWSAGAATNPLLIDSGLASRTGNGVAVNQWLQSKHYSNIFVIGDAASTPRPVAKQAFHAIDMGKRAGRNAVRYAEGKALKAYKRQAKPQLVTFGDLDTFMVFEDFTVSSSLLGVGKELVYNLGLIQLSPPRNPSDLLEKGKLLLRSSRRTYLPAVNPARLMKRLPRLRVKR